jgi:two-component system, cell cycle response regulator
MSPYVHAALTVRRTARASYGFAAAAGWMSLILAQRFSGALGTLHGVVLGALSMIAATRVLARWRLEDAQQEGELVPRRDVALLDLELGLLLLAAVFTLVQATGGLGGPLHPLVYVAVAFTAAFASKPMGWILAATTVAIELALEASSAEPFEPRRAALHVAFIGLFGALNVLFVRAEIARVRERSRKERHDAAQKERQDLRLFRLVGAPSSGAGDDSRAEERVARSSVSEVRDALYHVLELLKRTLDLHTCILLFSDPDGRLRIVELVTDSDDVGEGPFEAGAGAVGAVATRGLSMCLEHLKVGYKGLCYYRSPSVVRSFCAVPVVENGHLRGALCADRIEDRPFTPRDEEILKSAIAQVLRAIQNERVFVQLERSKREQAVLFKASQALGAALTEDQVIEAGLSAAGAIARYDFAAITRFDAEKKQHSVMCAVGEGAEPVRGLTFKDNASLTAMAVKNKHYLPYRGEFDGRQQTLYTSKVRMPDLRSVLVLPLVVREDAIGTLALATERSDAFPDTVRPTLQVLANQLAIALGNARAVKRLEEMATTDGLTGCLNKRAFLDELENKIRSAERFKKRLSLLVTDIDHFKSVNDTYGHATGDVVIKELGAILMRAKRETDRVARFGGEEFCVLCEETDTEGAVQLAERIRDELARHVFQTELGKLSVTCSIGVATYPHDAKNGAELFEITDKALYAAKRGGRNRVCTERDV